MRFCFLCMTPQIGYASLSSRMRDDSTVSNTIIKRKSTEERKMLNEVENSVISTLGAVNCVAHPQRFDLGTESRTAEKNIKQRFSLVSKVQGKRRRYSTQRFLQRSQVYIYIYTWHYVSKENNLRSKSIVWNKNSGVGGFPMFEQFYVL